MATEPSERLRKLTDTAKRLAAWYKSSYVDIEHLLLALLLDDRLCAAQFLGLTPDQITDVRDHLLQKLNEQLLEFLFSLVADRLDERGIAFEYRKDLIQFLIEQRDQLDSRSDAQQLDHLFHKLVADPLMEILLAESINSGDHIMANRCGDQITFAIIHAEQQPT